MDRLNVCVAACLVAGVMAVVAAKAQAGPTDLKELGEKPQSFLDQEVELVGFCVKGGRSGDVLGYECTTEQGIYLNADDIEPEAAKETLANCGATQSEDCRVTVTFIPHSYTTSGVIEPDRTITVFNAGKAKVSF
jgi:hypothetical protein